MATAEQMNPLGERVSRIEGGYEHLATKADLARVETDLSQMKAELKADIARVETDLKADIGRLDGEIGELRGEIGGLRGEIGGLHGEIGGLRGEFSGLRGEIRGIKWWIASAAAAVVALAGLAQILPLGG